MTTALYFFSAILGLAAGVGAAAPDGNTLVKASLVTDVVSVEAGKPFRVGVLFKIEPEYHIYWQNPGESGQPPEVKWSLPAGFVAGELQWPAPKKFMVPGAIFNFGYAESAMLVATITPPSELPPGKVEIAADCSWLVCNDDACVPGRAVVNLIFPETSSSSTAAKQKLDAAVASVPVPAGQSADVVRVAASGVGDSKSLTVEWKDRVSQIEFFPTANDSLKIQQTSMSTNTRATPPVTTIEIFAAPVAGARDLTFAVSGVLAYKTLEGRQRGIEISVPANKASP